MQIDTSTPSPSHESRQGQPISLIVLHATVGSLVSARGWLTNPASKASTHYLISKTGDLYQLVPDDRAAWHAGASQWGRLDSLAIKRQSIGIELENANDGRDPYPPAQVDALRALVRDLQQRYPEAQVVTHAQIARPAGRKTDPLGLDLALLRAPSPAYMEDSPILGATQASALTVAERLVKARQHYTPAEIRAIVTSYYRTSTLVGLNPLLAVAQMAHETGYLTSWWCDRAPGASGRRNPAGIGVTGATRPLTDPRPAPPDVWQPDPDAGLWRRGYVFPNWEAAVTAHVGRLLAYAVPPERRTPAQRALVTEATEARPLPDRVHGSAPTLKQLGQAHNPSGLGWASPGQKYGAAIAVIANALGGAP